MVIGTAGPLCYVCELRDSIKRLLKSPLELESRRGYARNGGTALRTGSPERRLEGAPLSSMREVSRSKPVVHNRRITRGGPNRGSFLP